ncbi:MAG: peptidoglycan bridge formation glycyltransferase FemA/FemB family protein [Chloroflexota bacterium]|nr:peptidoglycan bridge formation glycyltransferase FemA/FemB family protein [Chloroflexota bacterium]
MQVLQSTEPDFPSPECWDDWVAQSPRGHLLQTWAWGELKGAFGWTPRRLALVEDGAFLAGAQILYRHFGPFTLGYIPKGPLLAEKSPDIEDILWQAIHRQCRGMHAIALKVEPEWYDEKDHRHAWLRGHGLVPSSQCIQPRRTIIVGLEASEEDILMRMKSKWRYNVRLSIRRGVEVCKGEEHDVETFYDMMRTTAERGDFGIHSLAYYRRAWKLFAPQDRARLFMAYYEEEPLGGLMAYAFNGQSWYMYGASSNRHRNLMPNHQLQWRAMQWAKSKGCTQYDLWGITDVDPDSPTAELEGVERFKAGFGGKIVRYVGAYDYVYSKPLYWLLRKVWAYRQEARG